MCVDVNIDRFTGVYVLFQLICGYVETHDDDNGEIETCLLHFKGNGSVTSHTTQEWYEMSPISRLV